MLEEIVASVLFTCKQLCSCLNREIYVNSYNVRRNISGLLAFIHIFYYLILWNYEAGKKQLCSLSEFLRFKWASHSNQLNQRGGRRKKKKKENPETLWKYLASQEWLQLSEGALTLDKLWSECSVNNFSHSAEWNSLVFDKHSSNNLWSPLV